MTSTIKHVKNLRFSKKKSKNSVEFQSLRSQPIYSLIFNKESYQFLLAEVLIKVIRDLSESDDFDEDNTLRRFNKYEKRAKTIKYYKELTIPDALKKSIISGLKKHFENRATISDFKGNILEFYILYIWKFHYKKNKNSSSYRAKLIHESFPYYKRKKNFFATTFQGEKCDIDIIKVEKVGDKISLIECKFSIDLVIQRYLECQDRESFKKKVNYMDHLQSELSQYKAFSGNTTHVTKYFATFSPSTIILPELCTNYEILDVANELDKFISFIQKNTITT